MSFELGGCEARGMPGAHPQECGPANDPRFILRVTHGTRCCTRATRGNGDTIHTPPTQGGGVSWFTDFDERRSGPVAPVRDQPDLFFACACAGGYFRYLWCVCVCVGGGGGGANFRYLWCVCGGGGGGLFQISLVCLCGGGWWL